MAFELEPILDINEIQGNVLGGFNKDFQALLFLGFPEDCVLPEAVRSWILHAAERVTYLAEVVEFKRKFRALSDNLPGAALDELTSTWMNIALSHPAIARLSADASNFDDVFSGGLATSTGPLGDPADPAHRGHISHWLYGGTSGAPDTVVILASDREEELLAALQRERTAAEDAGLKVIHLDLGRDLSRWPSPLPSGREHFGFKDGISQPGIRGRLDASPTSFITPRTLPKGEVGVEYASPGQPLICPGEFVLGYPRQSDIDPRGASAPHPLSGQIESDSVGPEWAKNGSFLVIRRLNQDVPAFNRFLADTTARLREKPEFSGLTEEKLGALLVGRWRSGAPVVRAPEKDNLQLAVTSGSNNDFDFYNDTAKNDGFPKAPSDLVGTLCPAAAHIRKVNPRDLPTDQGGSAGTLVKRILRRGIPFGEPLPIGCVDDPAHGDRGLLFLSYQSSIRDQFEFLCKMWVNDESKPTAGLTPNSGFDIVIGQSTRSDRVRFINLGPFDERVETPRLTDWVYPSGGGYFFAPSRSALVNILGLSEKPIS